MKSRPQTTILGNDKFRRNAVLLLAGIVPVERAGPGPCTVYDEGLEAGPAAGSKCLGGMPSQPVARRNLHLSERRFRSGCLVGG